MNYYEKYLSRAKRAAKFLAYTPFLRMTGLNGSLVRGTATENSDIDFLIIARSGRLYTARFFATILVQLTGYRRHGKRVAGRICLNCYLSARRPNIFPQNKKNQERVARAYRYMIPLVDSGKTATKFTKNNRWLFSHKLKVKSEKLSFDGTQDTLSEVERVKVQTINEKFKDGFPIRPKKRFEKMLKGRFGDWVEAKLRDYQTRRILKGKNPGDEIYLTADEIRLHPKKG